MFSRILPFCLPKGNNNITGTIPPELGRLGKLTQFDLGTYQSTSLSFYLVAFVISTRRMSYTLFDTSPAFVLTENNKLQGTLPTELASLGGTITTTLDSIDFNVGKSVITTASGFARGPHSKTSRMYLISLSLSLSLQQLFLYTIRI